ncbi:MAG: c-type cytochrome [Polyangiaceae bacterium]
MTRGVSKCLFLCAFACCAACDESQARHDPHPSLERMQTQERVDPFDPKGMQSPPQSAVAIESEDDDVADGGAIPFHLDADFLSEGRASFDRFCAPCHGITGEGESVVASKMREAPPGSLVEGTNASLSPDAVYRVVRDGKRTMPSLAHELTRRERWATVAYLQALILSRHATRADLAAGDLDALDRGGAR